MGAKLEQLWMKFVTALERLLLLSSWRRFLFFVMGISAVLHLVGAWRIDGFYHCDEHFQVLELMGTKLGWVDPAGLPWEYPAQIRSWLQPSLYYAVLRAVALPFGLPNPFTAVVVLRVVTALVAWLAILVFARCLALWFADGGIRRAVLLCANFFYLMPLLDSRTSGENMSQAFVVFGLAALVLTERRFQDGLAPTRILNYFSVGACLGLAFLFRFQVGFMVLGLGCWTLAFGKRRLAFSFQAGLAFLAIVGTGVLLDRWGYGNWVFTPWRYLKTNILENKASEFGVSPWWGYLELYWSPHVKRPLGLFLLIAQIAAPFVARRHLLTWVTIPFFLGHVLVAHKETRFLFPALLCMMALGGLLAERLLPLFAQIASDRRRRVMTALVGLLGIVVVAINVKAIPAHLLRPRHRQVGMLNTLASEAPNGWRVAFSGQDPIHICGPNNMQLYAPDRWQTVEAGTFPESATILQDLPTFLSVTGVEKKIASFPVPENCVRVGPFPLAPAWLDVHLRRFRWYERALDWVGNSAVFRCASDPQRQLYDEGVFNTGTCRFKTFLLR